MSTQPRERAALCRRCLYVSTFNRSALCDRCLLKTAGLAGRSIPSTRDLKAPWQPLAPRDRTRGVLQLVVEP